MLWYLATVNLVAFVAMAADKWKARHNRWRIRERTLLLLAVIGGSVGAILGMTLFRHKTQHLRFWLGLPVIFALQLVAVWAIKYCML